MSESTENLDAQLKSDSGPDQAELGTPIAVFRPGLRYRVVLAACGALLLGIGFFFALVPSLSLLGCLMAPCGGLVVLLAYQLGNRRVLICPRGVIRILGREQVCCRWDEIREIVVCTPTAGGVKVVNRRCSLVRRDGLPVDLVDINVGQFGAMVDKLRQVSQPYAIPWKEEVVEPSAVDSGLRWVIYGVLAVGILGGIVAVVVLITVK